MAAVAAVAMAAVAVAAVAVAAVAAIKRNTYKQCNTASYKVNYTAVYFP